jgi:mRNA-degrading endonuclease RelE of RelBE toxin-antitoxin system
METINKYLTKKLDARCEFYNNRLKELGKTEEEFAESKELQKQLEAEFEEIWKLKMMDIDFIQEIHIEFKIFASKLLKKLNFNFEDIYKSEYLRLMVLDRFFVFILENADYQNDDEFFKDDTLDISASVRNKFCNLIIRGKID